MKNFKKSAYFATAVILTGCGLGNRANVKDGSLEITANFANSLVLPSGMSRQSGFEAVSKLIELFPQATIGGIPISDPGMQIALRSAAATDQINPEVYFAAERNITKIPDITKQNAYLSIVALNGIDRTTGPLALLNARLIFEDFCGQAQANPTITRLFDGTSAPSILLAGESFPTDPDLKMAFIVARRAWNFPYAADSEEVQILKNVYQQSSAATRKQQVCLAALLSDQFWQGNPDKLDIPNRVLLTLTGKRPTLQQLVDFSNDKQSFHQFIQSQQKTQSYLDNVARWHGSKMGLRTLVEQPLSHGFVTPSTEISNLAHATWRYYGANFGPKVANNASLPVVAATFSHEIDGCPAPARPSQDWTSSITGISRGGVPPNLNQPFDPRTTGIFWEQYDSTASKYKVLAGWILIPFLSQYKAVLNEAATTDAAFMTKYGCVAYAQDPRWLRCKGETFKGVQYSLDQIRNPNAPIYNASSPWNQPGAATAQPTPIVNPNCVWCKEFTTPSVPDPDKDVALNIDQGRVLRRVVRYSPTGRQDGYSTAYGYFTNQPVKICNSFARLAATCSYVPLPGYGPNAYYAMDTNGAYKGLNAERFWTADGFLSSPNLKVPTFQVGQGPGTMSIMPGQEKYVYLHTFAHPQILRGFRCGLPNEQVLSDTSATGPNYDSAFPGYEYLPPYTAGDELKTSWVPNTWQTGASLNPNSINNHMNRTYAAQPVDGGDHSEDIWAAIHTEMNREPYRLIQAAISNVNPVDNSSLASAPDYSLLVKSNFTFIPKYLELLYRSRSEIPYWPSNFQMQPNQSFKTLTQVFFAGQSAPFSSIPARLVNPASRVGWLNYDRPKAGLLQMPAIVGAMAPGSPRSMASRVFARFFCGEANLYDPASDNTMAIHDKHFRRLNVDDLTSPDGTIWAGTDPNEVTTYINATTNNPNNVKVYKSAMTNFMANHANRKDCMSCHYNLDPLGMALFKYYGTNLAAKEKLGAAMTGPEIGIPDNAMLLPAAVNARTNSSTVGFGALLGEEVTGFSGVADKIARSRQFYSCAAETAFQNMFGRMPTSIEARRAYKKVVDNFYDDKDYNKMILGLVAIQENLGGE